MADFWDVSHIQAPACVVCGVEATVVVLDGKGVGYGPHCGLHADERVNVENFPLRKAQNKDWKSGETKPNDTLRPVNVS